jgi:WD40 repeat protein
VSRIEDQLRDAYAGEAATVTPGSTGRLSEAIAAGLRTDRDVRRRRDTRSRRLSRVVTPVAAAAAVTVAIVLATQVLPRVADSRHSHAGTSGALTRPTVAGPLTGTFITSFKLPGDARVASMAFSPSGTTLATGDGVVGLTYLWDVATRKITATLTDPGGFAVTSVAFEPGITTALAAGDGNGRTYLWDTTTRKVTATFTDPGSRGVDSVAIGDSGTILATGDHNGRTYLWNVITRQLTAILANPGGHPVTSVALTPDGTELAASDDQGHIFVWDTATGKLTATLTDPRLAGTHAGVNSVAFSSVFAPRGATLAAGDADGCVYLWDTATRKLTATLTGHGSQGGVGDLAFGPDGFTLAAGRSGSTSLWDTAISPRAATLTGNGRSYHVESLAFGPSGSPLAAGDSDGSVILWRINRITP